MMSKIAFIRWWLLAIFIGGMCVQITMRANDLRSETSPHFKSAPVRNAEPGFWDRLRPEDTSRRADLPTIRARRYGGAELGWGDLFWLMLGYPPAPKPDLTMQVPQYRVQQPQTPERPSQRVREGTLGRAMGDSGRNTSFGTIRTR